VTVDSSEDRAEVEHCKDGVAHEHSELQIDGWAEHNVLVDFSKIALMPIE